MKALRKIKKLILFRFALSGMQIKSIKSLLRLLSIIILYQKQSFIPKKVKLEASTLCQLKCKSCNMWKEDIKKTGCGYLKYNDFKNFMDQNNFIKEVELSNNGEIFLNPDLIYILKYAVENNISLYADNGVNLNTVSDEVLEALVKYNTGGGDSSQLWFR